MRLKSVVLAKTFASKALGLMFRKKFDGVLVIDLGFETRRGAAIHTFFMRFDIDVFFVNGKYKVVDAVRNIKPWKILIMPKKACRYIVEARSGKLKAKVGQKLEW